MEVFDAYSYHCGVMDAFCEVVSAQVKQMALSHPFDSVEEMHRYLPYANILADRYHIVVQKETSLLITDLFPTQCNKGKCNIIMYHDAKVWQRYMELKEQKERLLKEGCYHGEERLRIAVSFGALLSYPKEKCLALIKQNNDKE